MRRLASIRSEDHFAADDRRPLPQKVRGYLDAQQIGWSAHRVLMLANARSLGYVFDPLTTYFCFDAEGDLEGVLAEVHNTYGERHCYPLTASHTGGASVDKEFYVSPFFAVEGRYDIRTRLTGDQVAVAISLTQGEETVFTASVHGALRPATRGRVLRAVARNPLPSQRVSALIRWHGVRLWLRRLPVSRDVRTRPRKEWHDRPTMTGPGACDRDARPAPGAPAYGMRGKIAREVVRRIMRGVPVSARLADGEVYGAPLTDDAPTLQVDQPDAFFGRLAHSPMIGLGESYMAREWSVADGTDLADALSPFAEKLTDLIKPVFYKLRHAVLPRGLNPANTRAGARKNIEAHYDLSNEMFQQFLDPTMSYSSALFSALEPAPSLADLEPAQLHKVDAILDAADVTRARGSSRSAPAGAPWRSGPPSAARR